MRRVPVVALLLWSFLVPHLCAQDAVESPVFKMEPFNVRAYSGKIRIVDGFTGRDYEGTHAVVTDFARSFNKILLGFHKKLVNDEVKHLEMRYLLGRNFEREVNQLSAEFGFSEFALDHKSWLMRERSILSRLVREPFFEIKTIVVWDLDRLRQDPAAKPDNKYARDIRADPETGRWERRITATWDVFFARNGGEQFSTEKLQGLNLETQRGYHFIELGLPLNVPPNAFRKVQLTYPIFYSHDATGSGEVTRLQENLVANLNHLYDPFSWVYRRHLRFRGGFLTECLEHIRAQRLPVRDREWLNPVLARFFSDVAIVKLQGAREIYAYHMQQKRHAESPNSLGLGLDLLNWNKGEARAATDRPEANVRLALDQPHGFRFVLLDAYLRHGDAFVAKVRDGLRASAAGGRDGDGRAIFTEAIEALSGLSYADYAARAKAAQEEQLNRFRLTRPAA
jgi:hypothetical protein